MHPALDEMDFHLQQVKMMEFRALRLLALVSFGLLGCGDDVEATSGSGPGLDEDLTREAIENYAEIVHASYVDSLTAAEAMQAEIEAFLEDPSEATLLAARDSWRAAREPYLQTEVYRFYEGP